MYACLRSKSPGAPRVLPARDSCFVDFLGIVGVVCVERTTTD